MAKFCHFGKKLKAFDKYLQGLFRIGPKIEPTLQCFYAIGQFFILVVNGQILKKEASYLVTLFIQRAGPPPLTRLFNPTFTSRVGSVIPFYEGTSSSAFKGVKVTTRVTLCLFVCLSVCPSSLIGDETV